MENIRRLYWAGAITAVGYSIVGIIVAIQAGFPPVLFIAVLFSLAGAAAASRGASRADLAWWAGGVLLTGFITPTTWGIAPMIIAITLVLVVSILLWREVRRRQDPMRGTKR
ncbi:hypothetical protein EJO69_04300 [Flaviflexus salsibiostraticola]|uniref:SPW repeat-containing protein n=1 Tax=Flaviflexus salsibiostraticola TaxID=1282737 RepID=A0A3S8Z8A8_9ACTO|nr:hypothetical protein [Flaviflexus salsibiostraticola]AZN29615.1 hypothetical protein EJO69_04300 [Flaviflexus salsibiostraticola]